MKDEASLPSPHNLIAIPRSLVDSKIWQELPKMAQLFFLHLLMFSNAKTFKPVWPGQQLLHVRTKMHPFTQRQQTYHLVEAGLLLVHKPGTWTNPDTGNRVPSKVYEFTITDYINQDIANANKKAVAKGLPPRYKERKDIYRLERTMTKLLRARRVQEKEIRNIKNKVQAAMYYLDFAARLIKIVGVDSGAVHIEIHTDSKPLAKYVEENLPKNVLLFPKKYSQNVVINKYRSWAEFENAIANATLNAAHRQESDMFDRLIAQVAALTPDSVANIKNAG